MRGGVASVSGDKLFQAISFARGRRVALVNSTELVLFFL